MKSCRRCPCPEGCLLCPSRYRAALVLASSSAYKRFSELLPKEERGNVCSTRVPKSQLLTLPELRVRCWDRAAAPRVWVCLGRALFTSHGAPDVLFQQSRGEAVPLPLASCANKQLPGPHCATEGPGHSSCPGWARSCRVVMDQWQCGVSADLALPRLPLTCPRAGRRTPSSTRSAGCSPPRTMVTGACPLRTSSTC